MINTNKDISSINIRWLETEVWKNKWHPFNSSFKGKSKVLQYLDPKEGWVNVPTEFNDITVE